MRDSVTRTEPITARQREVARLVALGKTNPEIAEALGISLDGAKYHVSELLGRLGLERREQIGEWYRAEAEGARGPARWFAALGLPVKLLAGASVLAVAAGAAVLLSAALGGARAREVVPEAPAPTQMVEVTPTVEATPTPAAPVVPGALDPASVPEPLRQLVFVLAQRLASAPLEITDWEQRDWFDGCFDLPFPGGCPLSISPVPGYRVVMRGADGEYVLRTDINVGRYRLESAPPVDVPDPVIEWTGPMNPFCLELHLGADMRGSIAGCGEPATPIAGPPNADPVFIAFLRSLGSGVATTPEGTLRLNGDPAGSPLDRPQALRAAREWARYSAEGAYSGRVGAAYGLAIAWRDAAAEGCQGMEVTVFGLAYLSACPDGTSATFVLGEEQLATLYGWLDRLGPFDVPTADDAAYLVFSGQGSETATPEVRDAILAWVESLAATSVDDPAAG